MSILDICFPVVTDYHLLNRSRYCPLAMNNDHLTQEFVHSHNYTASFNFNITISHSIATTYKSFHILSHWRTFYDERCCTSLSLLSFMPWLWHSIINKWTSPLMPWFSLMSMYRTQINNSLWMSMLCQEDAICDKGSSK